MTTSPTTYWTRSGSVAPARLGTLPESRSKERVGCTRATIETGRRARARSRDCASSWGPRLGRLGRRRGGWCWWLRLRLLRVHRLRLRLLRRWCLHRDRRSAMRAKRERDADAHLQRRDRAAELARTHD